MREKRVTIYVFSVIDCCNNYHTMKYFEMLRNNTNKTYSRLLWTDKIHPKKLRNQRVKNELKFLLILFYSQSNNFKNYSLDENNSF